ncbi:hypothetical protein [Phytobacter sp. V91]
MGRLSVLVNLSLECDGCIDQPAGSSYSGPVTGKVNMYVTYD